MKTINIDGVEYVKKDEAFECNHFWQHIKKVGDMLDKRNKESVKDHDDSKIQLDDIKIKCAQDLAKDIGESILASTVAYCPMGFVGKQYADNMSKILKEHLSIKKDVKPNMFDAAINSLIKEGALSDKYLQTRNIELFDEYVKMSNL